MTGQGHARARLSRQPQLLAAAVSFRPGGARGRPQGCALGPLAASCAPTLDGIFSARSPSSARAAEQVSAPARVGRPTPAIPDLGEGGEAWGASIPQTRLRAMGETDPEDAPGLKERTVSQGGWQRVFRADSWARLLAGDVSEGGGPPQTKPRGPCPHWGQDDTLLA